VQSPGIVKSPTHREWSSFDVLREEDMAKTSTDLELYEHQRWSLLQVELVIVFQIDGCGVTEQKKTYTYIRTRIHTPTHTHCLTVA
jgi:hypothetical protein